MRHTLGYVLLGLGLAACSGAVAPSPKDTDVGHGFPGDGGADGADGSDGAHVEPDTQYCECCGAHVAWPASESCDMGACDGYCNCEPPATPHNPPGCPDHYVYQTGECSPVGLQCTYPGEGDGSGCSRATAGLWCKGDDNDAPDAAAEDSGDGGADGGATTGHWIPTQ